MEALPPTLTSACEQPLLYDGTTRLYMSYVCPYAQRAWITRNYKGLQEEIKLVPMDLADKPAWYKKVYPKYQVPAMEHNKKIIGESLDLIRLVIQLVISGSSKQRFAVELLGYSDAFNRALLDGLRSKGPVTAEAVAALDKIDSSLSKFDDGPFFLGQFSLVDIAYVPFIDGFQMFFAGIKNYDITRGRVHMQTFTEELNKIDAYTQMKQDPQMLLALTKKFGV
ncbi:protein IN2-1 homolog B-like isoform X1 [Panicum hallii]|uniref:protein IN2-1 homolog B-like isoform X1 n=1 Tax=Panicum hallii TaxID=206008 RepID=UPI000DF4DA13|nr:protein IN2-1 homolog B-like isoform X1 [Panicum hallii]XP_025796089.1 protein IN2-1 homolog B-like isoform X1 [Panicum hallii]